MLSLFECPLSDAAPHLPANIPAVVYERTPRAPGLQPPCVAAVDAEHLPGEGRQACGDGVSVQLPHNDTGPGDTRPPDPAPAPHH